MAQNFIPHLEELRRRLLVSLAFFFVASVVSYFFSSPLLDFLIIPLRKFQEVNLYFQKPYEAFLTHLKVAVFAGLIFSLPVFFTQAWLFIAPGLYPYEKKVLFVLIFASIFLFLTGAWFAYGVVIPWGLHFLLGFQTENLEPLIGIGPYFGFLTGMMLAFGILFDFPVVLTGLVKLGVLKATLLAKSRRLVIVVIFVTAAILTPSPDPFSQLLLAVPLVILFEVSLLIAKWLERKK